MTSPANAPPANTQIATIHGRVTYTPGEGVPIVIPEGAVELIISPDSTTFSWTREDGVVGSAAIPNDQYDQYVQDGKIILQKH